MARLGDPVPGPWDRWDDRGSEQTNELRSLEAEAARVPEGTYVGTIIRFQVADGYALYRVESEQPLVIAHIPAFDGYRIPDAHVRGLEIDDIKAMVARERAWSRLVGEKGAGR